MFDADLREADCTGARFSDSTLLDTLRAGAVFTGATFDNVQDAPTERDRA
jgi:uncharacterized protein YjbI with pentapeptide repeats